MANNGYREPYQQGAPQRQYYNNQYDQRQFEGQRNNQMNNQRGQGPRRPYNEHYNEQDYQSHENLYDQYGQYDGGNYQEPQRQDYHSQPQDQYDMNPAQQRSYQYDDRYRSNGQSRPPVPYAQERQPVNQGGRNINQSNNMRPAPRGNDSYSHNGYSNRLPKVRDRILQPDSPVTPSWDNPFPTFPSKKKLAESRRPGSSDEKKTVADNSTQPSDLQRPSTSHSNYTPHSQPPPELPRPSTAHSNHPPRPQPAPELPRPSTSHSQRNVEPLNNSANLPAMPLRKELPPSRPHTSHSQRQYEDPSYPPGMPPRQNSQGGHPQYDFQQGLPPVNGGRRPVPRRAVTGPTPQQDFDVHSPVSDFRVDAQTDEIGHGGRTSERYFNEPEHRSPPPQNYDEQNYNVPPSQQRNASAQVPYSNGTSGHRRRSSGQSYGRDQDIDQGSYRGVQLTKQVSPDMPNFDALPQNSSERFEGHMGQPLQQNRAYQRPTYQNTNPPQSLPQQRRSVDRGHELVSPLAQFSFNIDDDSQQQSRNTPQTPTFYDRAQPYQASQSMQAGMVDGSKQYPQRTATRPQEPVPNNLNGGYPPIRPSKGNLPFRPGLNQPLAPDAYHERNGQGYEQDLRSPGAGYGQNDDYSRPGLPQSQSSYHRESSRQGFDQRILSRPGIPSSAQIPPRPATSNSGHPRANPDFELRNSSDSFQRPPMQNPDSLPAHPVPFRPGLMQQGPPRPRPTPPPPAQPQVQTHQRAPSGPKPPAEAEPPITIQELNMMQQEYKSNPNNFALGLKFAKRLVEAAKVLANENGRADAKQTAKNRERYILDAHKIVKRLCSAGYAEAMFYLADCYGQGLLGLASDPKEAFSLYTSAAKLGHPQGAYRVAVCCELGAEEGGGTRRDPPKAVQWYKRAASLGDTPAMYKMGMIQLKGLLGQPKSPREAISWLKRAAERADADNPHALHELGMLYGNAQPSDIVIRDEKYALQLFEQAANLGYKYSQWRLGSAYEYGLLGLPIDPRMSIAWYSRAAKQGEHQSEFALSGWYLTGSGTANPGEPALLPQSDTEAYLWARKAASSGLAKAEYAMGYYTEVGIGVASNIEEAKRWYYRAAAQNFPKARERLEDLKKGGQRMQKTRVSRSNVGKNNEGECAVM